MAKGWGSIYKGCEAYWPAGQDGVETPQQAPSPGTPQALVSPPTTASPVPQSWLRPATGPTGTAGPYPVERALGVGLEMGVFRVPAAVHFGSSPSPPPPFFLKTPEEEDQPAL